MYLDRDIDIYWYYNDNSNNRNGDSDGGGNCSNSFIFSHGCCNRQVNHFVFTFLIEMIVPEINLRHNFLHLLMLCLQFLGKIERTAIAVEVILTISVFPVTSTGNV